MKEIEDKVLYIRRRVPRVVFNQRWDEECPLKLEDITKLRSEGVRVIERPLLVYGQSDFDRREILIDSELTDYDRDITLLHEITHFIFPPKTIDPSYDILRNSVEVITDWIARRSRLNAGLLRGAVRSFKLKHFIYDRVSFEAFYPKPSQEELAESYQLTFPFYPKTEKHQRMQERYSKMAARYRNMRED